MSFWEKLLSITGSAGFLVGLGLFAKWYIQKYLQNLLDIKLESFKAEANKEIEKLRAELDRFNHIKKNIFDKRYEIYTKLWEKINDVSASIETLYHSFEPQQRIKKTLRIDFNRNDLLKDENIAKYSGDLSVKIREVYNHLTHIYPFIDSEVYKTISEFINFSSSFKDEFMRYILVNNIKIIDEKSEPNLRDEIKNDIRKTVDKIFQTKTDYYTRASTIIKQEIEKI